MNGCTNLETAALDAHRRGDTWAAFYREHAAALVGLCGKEILWLLALVVSGDTGPKTLTDLWGDGERVDRQDRASPPDAGTRARIDWATIGWEVPA